MNHATQEARVKIKTTGRGAFVPAAKIALDSSAPGAACIISHAHGDHIPQDANHAYASAETADLLAIRAPHITVTRLPWREPTRVGNAIVTLLPSGHVLGGALTLLEYDNEALLYTADTKTTPSLTCAPAEFVEADILIVESTFGLPIYHWPDRAELRARISAFANACLAEGTTPVFLAYSLGKGQEMVRILGEAGIPTAVHGATWNLCATYAKHGVTFPQAHPYAAETVEGRALVVPPAFRGHPMVTRLDARVALVSGWGLLSRARSERDADELIPLSDHADFPGLLDIVARVKPRRIYANHGYADVFAHILKKRGHDALPLAVGHTDEESAGAA